MAESDKLIRNEAEAIECLKSNKPTSGYVMLQESIDVAIKALEKQIPKKYMRKNGNYNCPICDYPVMSVCARKKKYCDNCGQAIDWSDEE